MGLIIMTNSGGWRLQAVPLIGIGIAGALFLWGFKGVIAEWLRVQRILRQSLGIDARSAVLKFAGKVIALLVLAGLVGCVFLLPRFFPGWPMWASLIVVYLALIAWRLSETDSVRSSLPDAAGFLGILLTSGLQTFPSGAARWIVFAVAATLFLAAIFLRQRPKDPGAPSMVSWSALNAYNAGDYALAVERASQKDQIQHERGSTLAAARYRRREFDDAEALVRSSLALQVDGRRAAPLTILLAQIQIERGQFDEAGQTLDAATEMDCNNAASPRLRTLVALRQGKIPPPIPPPGGPETPLEAAIRAWTLAENGLTDQAREAIQQAVVEPQPLPDLAETCYYAGRALMRCSDCALAERYFQIAMRAEGNFLFGSLAEQESARQSTQVEQAQTRQS